jgi:hypothetical protein
MTHIEISLPQKMSNAIWLEDFAHALKANRVANLI